MKPCGYCGRENDEEATRCGGCGSSLASSGGEAGQPSPSAAEQPPPIAAGQPSPNVAQQRLGARSATLILLVYFGVQFAIGVGAGMAATTMAGIKGVNVADPGEQKRLVRAITAPVTVLGFIAGGAAMLVVSKAWIRPFLSDTSSTGAAWVLGSFKHIAQGVIIGAFTAGCYWALTPSFQSSEDEAALGPIATMAATPGLQQLLWLFLMLLAPFVEELLFRGVLYGGYRSSFGPVPAAFLTTAIFWVIHLTETIHFWPAMLAIAGLAIVALWFRLRSAAIGPAVAVHFGYNWTIAALVLSSTWK